jgi:hypothetical protein
LLQKQGNLLFVPGADFPEEQQPAELVVALRVVADPPNEWAISRILAPLADTASIMNSLR